MTLRFMLALLFLGGAIFSSQASDFTPLQRRGELLAARLCADCHAVGRSDQSPHAGAPAFRSLDRDVDLDGFMTRLREGLTSGHPDMATFRFSRRDARAFVLYIRAIQAP